MLSLTRAPLGTITIDSALPAEEVIENLRRRGKEWRDSDVPADLKTFKVLALVAETKGSEFEIYWRGKISPFYNPVCFGTVEQTGTGSRILAGFKLLGSYVMFVSALAAMPILALLNGGSTLKWTLAAIMYISLGILALKNRGSEPMRARLIEALAKAAGQTDPVTAPFSATMATNGP